MLLCKKKNKPKVAFVTPSLSIGGVERWMISLAKHFIDVEPIGIVILYGYCDPFMEKEAQRYCPVYRHPNGGMLERDEARNLLNMANVVMSWECPDLGSYKISPLIIDTSHNEPIWEPQRYALEKAAVFATHYAAVSNATAVTWPETVRDKVRVIYNGIEIDRVLPRYGRDHKRKQLGVKENENLILFLGRLHEQKRPDLLAASMKHLSKDYKLVFSGAPSGDKNLDKEIVRIAGNEFGNRIQIIEPKTHVGDLFAASDVFVLPSKFEGMPMVLLEAMAAGVPCITTDYTAAKELANNFGEMFNMLPTELTPERLATEIVMTSMIGREASVVKCAQQICLHNFNASRMAADWEKFITEIVSEKR
jgi:glycosyltransferase involved in cell wall biosynthesis